MKIENRPDDASVLEMDDWIAQLRGDGADPAGDGGPIPGIGTSGPVPGTGTAAPPANGFTGSAEIGASVEITERAAIGDGLRIPIAWCEIGSCISHHADPAALGEADIRARAISAGWRIDALGRLACPTCQQSDPGFWPSHPVALWDRNAALTMAALMAAAVRNDGTGDSAASRRD